MLRASRLILLAAIGLLITVPAASATAAFSGTPETVATATPATAYATKIVPDNSGALYVFYIAPSVSDGTTPHLWVKKRAVGASPWGSLATDLTGGLGAISPQFEVVVAGTQDITVAFQEGTGTSSSIKTRTHRFSSDVWGGQFTVSDSGKNSSNVQLTTNDFGALVVAWEHRGTNSSMSSQAWIVAASRSSSLTADWSAPNWVSAPGASDTATAPDVAIDKDGQASAIWVQGPAVGTIEVRTSSATIDPQDFPVPPSFSAPVTLSNSGVAMMPRIVAHFLGTTNATWLRSLSGNDYELFSATRPSVVDDPSPAWPAPAAAEAVSVPGDEVGAYELSMTGNRGFAVTWSTNIPGAANFGVYARERDEAGSWGTTQTLAESAGVTPPYYGSPSIDRYNTGGTLAFKENSGGVWGSFRSGAATVWNAKVHLATSATAVPVGSITRTNYGGVVWQQPVDASSSTIMFTPWAVAPVNDTLPSTPTGTPQVGSTLTSSMGAFTGFGITYDSAWRVCINPDGVTGCTAKSGATPTTYVPVAADVGMYVAHKVIATNAGGQIIAQSAGMIGPITAAGSTPPANNTPPSISGTAAANLRLTATNGSWTNTPTSYDYQWQRCITNSVSDCADANGQTSSTYDVLASDATNHRYFRVGVTAHNGGGQAGPVYSTIVGPVPSQPSASSAPSLSGTAKVGEELSTGGGSWINDGDNRTNQYVWLRCTPGFPCSGITGATSPRYTITLLDVGTRLQVRVIADSPTNGVSDPVFSAQSSLVPPVVAPANGNLTVSGKNFIGQSLSANATFTGDAAPITYVWQKCNDVGEACSTITFGSSFTVPESMLGFRTKVVATASNSSGSSSAFRLFNMTGRAPSSNCAGLVPGADDDGDSIINLIECDIVRDKTGGAFMDLPSLGADPKHKDLFIEVDAMASHTLRADAANDVMRAFDQSPVSNPDGRTGIRLHIDNGATSPTYYGSPTTWGGLTRASTTIPENAVTGSYAPKTTNYDWTAFDAIKATNFDPIRRYAFFYMLSMHQYALASNTSSGIARANGFAAESLGQDFIMSLGGFGAGEYQGSEAEQSGTLMHEFGHLLGLGHGGRPNGVADGENFKPNYPSIMSYNWQMSGISKVAGGSTLDYSRFGSAEFDSLNESSLNEKTGVVARGGAAVFKVMHSCTNSTGTGVASTFVTVNPNTNIDWNCSGTATPIQTKAVAYDINRTNDNAGKSFADSKTTLVPADDWSNLVYSGGAIGSAGASAGSAGGSNDGVDTVDLEQVGPVPVITSSPNIDSMSTLAALLPRIQAASGDRAKPTIKIVPAKQKQGQKAIKVTITVRDNKRVDRYTVQDGKVTTTYVVAGSKKLATRVLTLKKGKHTIIVTARDGIGATFALRKTIVVR